MRVAIYARVSSVGQRERHTIESQLAVLPTFVAAQGWELARSPYVDDGLSGAAAHLEVREGFQRLLVDAAAGHFEVVVVIDFDRITRSDDLRRAWADPRPATARGGAYS